MQGSAVPVVIVAALGRFGSLDASAREPFKMESVNETLT